MDLCLNVIEQKDDAFISNLQSAMNDQVSSTIQKEEMPFKSSGILPTDRGSVLYVLSFSFVDSLCCSTCGW